jgi:hypothetical protein
MRCAGDGSQGIEKATYGWETLSYGNEVTYGTGSEYEQDGGAAFS